MLLYNSGLPKFKQDDGHRVTMHPTRILLAAALVACLPAAYADDNKLTLENRIAQCQGCHGIPDWKTSFPEVYRRP